MHGKIQSSTKIFKVQNRNHIITDYRILQYYTEIVQFYLDIKQKETEKKQLVGNLRQIFLKVISVKTSE